MSAKPRGVPLYNTSEMEHLRKLADGQGEEIALLHGENRELRAEVERLRKQREEPCTCPSEIHYADCRVTAYWETLDNLKAEIKRLRAAAQRVMKAYAGNDWGEQMKAIGALSDALCPPGGIRNDFDA